MSIDNRDYMRNKPPSGGFGIASWSMISRLLVINVVVFLLQNTVFYQSPMFQHLALTGKGLGSGMVFQLVTYQFLHASLWHLAGNMLGLYFLGKMAEQLLGGKHVLWIYLLGGALGGIAQVLFDLASGIDMPIVGASGSVLALVLAVATLVPHQTIYFLVFFVLPVKLTLRQAASIILVINVVTLLFQLSSKGGGGDSIAVFGHFGGMFLGWAYVTFILPASKRHRSDRKRSASMKKRFGIRVIKNAEMTTTSDDPNSSDTSEEKQKPFVSADVDAILDKISAEGMQSLTDKERKTLERSSKKLGRKIDGH